MLKTAKLLLLPVLLVGAAFLFQQSRELWLNGALWTMVYALVLLMGYFYYRERQQRIRAEENERLYRETFEQTSLGIAHVTENGRWLRVNSRFCEILGYSREELLQKTFQEITHPDDLNKDVELARQVWTRKIPSYTLEKRYVRKDGSLVWALLSVSLSTTKTGEPQYFISSAKDISIRKQAEEALMESTIQLRLATEAAQLGIWEYDLSTRRFRGSGRQWQLLGLDEPGDNFAPFNLSNHIHKDDRANVEATFLAAIQAKSEFSCEYRFQNAKGEKIWLESIGSPLLDAEGNVVRMVGVNMDITNRKLAQIDFQRSVDVSPAILWISEKDGECSYLSQQWYAFTGQTKKEALGLGWLNAVHHEDREHAYQFFSKANANREPYYVEYRLRTAVDDYRWVIDAGNPRYDSDGFFLGYAGTIFDIHDKKLAQARLEDTVQQFKALANSIPQLAWMADSNGKLFWFNERWFQYTGTTPEEMQQDGWIKVHHPDHVDRVMKRLNQSLATGEIWEDTFPIRSVSGGWRWFLSRAYPLFSENGQIERWFGTNTDITELREFQIALAKSETSFRDLANSMPQLIWTADDEGRVDYYNERAAEFDGFQRLTDGSWNWQPGLHPDDLERTVSAWRDAVKQKMIYTCEHRLRMKDGSYRWHLSRAIPVFQSDGEIRKWYGTATNIQEYKLALVELAKAKEIAEEANKAKSRFLANMSHEIRSPMSSVLGYADLLLEKGLSEADRVAYASTIKASGGHLLAIIDDILDLSAVESGEFKIDRHSFAVMDLIDESVKSMSILAQRKGLDLQVVFETPVPGFIESDPLRFRQILLNLLSNAIKFTEKGRIVVKLSYQNQSLKVEVEDTGLGIEPSKSHKLFQAFSQVDSSISRKYGGTGLGLHLSKRLAQALGGDLKLNWSIPGCGSSFIFQVETGKPTATPFIQSFQDISRVGAKANHLAETSARQCHVLLAEDSTDNQILIKIFLKKFGARVDVANNGEEALNMVMKGNYDLVLMDMMMPVMDGLEATRRLRAAGFQKPIVALTAHALKEEVEKSITAGCDLHLSKPIQMDVLSRTLNLLLDEPHDKSRLLEPPVLH